MLLIDLPLPRISSLFSVFILLNRHFYTNDQQFILHKVISADKNTFNKINAILKLFYSV